MQLATVGEGTVARDRTVVFRGYGPDSEILVFTDLRSAKCAELTARPHAEICWYLRKTREQFRLQVRMEQHGATAQGNWAALRERAWQDRGAPGHAEWLGAIPDAPLALPVPEFIVLAASVDHVEHLELRTTPQARTRYRREARGGWRTLAP